MRELSLQELKEIELEILKVFDAFCKENNIRYYLSHGTLLGAIRYKKFIPWDDDVDLLIPREDYNRMITLFKDTDRYKLFAFEKYPEYRYPIAKLCDMTTRKVETGYNNGVELGVDIDLFPLDAWDDDLKKAKKEAKEEEAKIEAQKLALSEKLLSSNYFTQEEIDASEEIKVAISELDENKINSILANKVVAKAQEIAQQKEEIIEKEDISSDIESESESDYTVTGNIISDWLKLNR